MSSTKIDTDSSIHRRKVSIKVINVDNPWVLGIINQLDDHTTTNGTKSTRATNMNKYTCLIGSDTTTHATHTEAVLKLARRMQQDYNVLLLRFCRDGEVVASQRYIHGAVFINPEWARLHGDVPL